MEAQEKERLKAVQERLAKKVIITQGPLIVNPKELLFSLDVQYDGDDAYVAVDIQEWGGRVIGQFLHHTKTTIPYIPGLFSFREGEVLALAIKTLTKEWQLKPSLLVVDGHGTAHPRQFGVACWLGVALNLPTVGIAKEPLIKYEGDLANERGAELPLKKGKQIIGTILRSQQSVKPIYVSAGHLVSQEAAAAIALYLADKYRICEPIRRADHVARRFAKGEFEAGMVQFEYKG